MVDSLPPSGTDLDNQTIISNSNDELSVALDDEFLDVGSSGKVKVFEPTYYLSNFDQDSGDWTGIDSVSDGIATVNVPDQTIHSASVTADLTGIDALKFRVRAGACSLEFEFDGNLEGSTYATSDFVTLEISGLDHYGANTTVKIEADPGPNSGTFWIDYVRGLSQPKSRKIELVDTGGLP
jgi:hypothetical protein